MLAEISPLISWMVGDEQLEIPVERDVSAITSDLENKTSKITRGRLHFPQIPSKKIGRIISNDTIYLRPTSQFYGRRHLFPTGHLFYFKGKYEDNNSQLIGKFQFINPIRFVVLGTYVILFALEFAILLFLFIRLISSRDISSFLNTAPMLVGIALPISLTLYFVRLSARHANPSKDEIRNLLIEVLESQTHK